MDMSLTDDDKQWIQQVVAASEQRMVALITSVKESLEREISGLRDDLTARLDNMSASLDRQDGWMKTGGRRIVVVETWAEKVDQALELKDRQIAEIRQRLERLEAGNRPDSQPDTKI